jgi:hypothetical protein
MNPPKLNRFNYAAMLLGAMAVAGTPLAYPAIATAERVWDIEEFDNCMDAFAWQQMDMSINEQKGVHEACCEKSGGVFTDDGYLGKCSAPPGDAKGSRQLPGNVHIPSDIALEPVTKAPPRPIQVPTDIATATAVSQAPA